MSLVTLSRYFYELYSPFDGHAFERGDMWALDTNHAATLLMRQFMAKPHPRYSECSSFVIQMADNEVAIDEFIAELDAALQHKVTP
ncbi:MAG: hypothetical protein M3440_04935 [Chloroflexota bacterium]|nr:hypothetical protein [Chloroflexota bacterium]